MSNARNLIPLLSAIAAWTVMRAGGSLDSRRAIGAWRSATVPYPIYRGLTQ